MCCVECHRNGSNVLYTDIVHKPAVGRHVVRWHYSRTNRHRLVVVLSVCRSLQWAERHSVANVDRIPTLPDNVANVDSHPGIASSDCTICPVQRYHLHHHCKVLEGIANHLINYQIYTQLFFLFSSSSTSFAWLFRSPILFNFSIWSSCVTGGPEEYLRCFWHPSTFSGQSQLWAFSLYSRPPMHNCSVAVPFQQVQ